MLKYWSARCRNPLCSKPTLFSYKNLSGCAVACLRCNGCGTRYRLLVLPDHPPEFKEDEYDTTLLAAFTRFHGPVGRDESLTAQR